MTEMHFDECDIPWNGFTTYVLLDLYESGTRWRSFSVSFLYRKIIRWSVGEGCHEGEFVMTEPESVARFVSLKSQGFCRHL